MLTREHFIVLGSVLLYGVTALAWAVCSGVGKAMMHDARVLDLCVYGTVAYSVFVVLLLFCTRLRRREGVYERMLRMFALAGVTVTATAQPFLLVYLWLALKHASLMIPS